MNKPTNHPSRKKSTTRHSPLTTQQCVVGLDMEARREARLQAVAVLRGGRTPLQLVEVAAQAASVAAGAVQTALAKTPPRAAAACREGCAWCCHQVVGTAAPEVVRIVEYLRQSLSPEAFEALGERVTRTDEQRQALKKDRWAAAHLPCPLLVEDRCSGYLVRPLTCRGFNSSDARACEHSVTKRTKVEVPVYAPQHRLTAFVLDGLRAGLEEAGLKAELLELTAALRIALTVPDAVERFLRGERVFAPARLP
jgi:Fe-S-cluster containining protein